MKILIITQKVDKNDDVLGFFHDWIVEFAKQYEKVSVVCLEKGEFSLPANVVVFSLGKEQLRINNETVPAGRQELRIISRIVYLFKFYRYTWKLRNDYDFVFVHMIPMYAVLGAPFWVVLKKKVALWYAHGHVSPMLRMAEKWVDVIFTSTTEGCRLNSDKIKIVGQGIDTGKFFNEELKINNETVPAGRDGLRDDGFINIISVGRIAPVKNYETLIRAAEILVKDYKMRNVRVKIVGAALLDEHEHYFRKLKKLVSELKLEKYVEFTGSIPYKNIVQHLQEADLMASTSKTGSLDKVMLEAMSMEIPVLSCSEAMRVVFLKKEKQLMYKTGDFSKLAELIIGIINMPDGERKKLGKNLRNIVIENHSLESLVVKIKECVE